MEANATCGNLEGPINFVCKLKCRRIGMSVVYMDTDRIATIPLSKKILLLLFLIALPKISDNDCKEIITCYNVRILIRTSISA